MSSGLSLKIRHLIPGSVRFLNSTGLRIRSYSVSANSTCSGEVKDFHETVHIPLARGNDHPVHSVWLRHHCECPECFNHKTYQRIKIPSFLRSSSKAVSVSLTNQDKTLSVSWNDGHVSEYSIDWLSKYSPTFESHSDNFDKHLSSSILPLDKIFKGINTPLENPFDTAVAYKDFMKEGNDGVRHLLTNILKHGYGIVNECPPDFETTKKVILKVSHPQNTIYGDFSEWTNDLAHADTAYTSDVVHLHTDTTYFQEQIGLQIFHCLKHEGTGGLNSLADGFHIVRKIAQDHPDLYKILASVYIPSQYIEPGKHHFLSFGKTIGHDSMTGKINKIRYNPHDMAILSHIPHDHISKFYESLVLLSDLLEEKPTRLKLSPGIVLFMDNWRVLHGREAFTGLRHLCGAYISRSDWLSKARVLGLLENY